MLLPPHKPLHNHEISYDKEHAIGQVCIGNTRIDMFLVSYRFNEGSKRFMAEAHHLH